MITNHTKFVATYNDLASLRIELCQIHVLVTYVWTDIRQILQVTGAIWYLLSRERNDTCWREACTRSGKCKIDYLYCGNKHMAGCEEWQAVSDHVLITCSVADEMTSQFKYGIYTQAIASGIVESRNFFSKFCYCLWWGMQNLRYISSSISFPPLCLSLFFSVPKL